MDMETSILLAKLIGPLFVIVGVGVLINPIHYHKMIANFINNAELYYFSGALAFVTGVAIINYHNVWVQDWRVAITLAGWLSLVKGTFRIVYPTAGSQLASTAMFSKNMLYIYGVFILSVGAWLCTKAF